MYFSYKYFIIVKVYVYLIKFFCLIINFLKLKTVTNIFLDMIFFVVDPVHYAVKCLIYLYKMLLNTRLMTKPKEMLSNIKQRFARAETPIEGNDVDIEDVSFVLNVY